MVLLLGPEELPDVVVPLVPEEVVVGMGVVVDMFSGVVVVVVPLVPEEVSGVVPSLVSVVVGLL